MKRTLALLLALTLFAVVIPVARAWADDCVALGGVVVGAECQIATTVQKSGGFTIGSTLHILGPGHIIVPATATGNSLTLNIAGALLIDVPSPVTLGSIIGDSAFAGPNPTGIGATITINTTGDIVLQGNGAAGAQITSNGDPLNCALSGRAGNIFLTSSAGNISVVSGAAIQSNSQCPAGEIVLNAQVGDITVGGLIESVSGALGNGTFTVQKGGPITFKAAGQLTIAANAFVRSEGFAAGADRVHLESGRDTLINGFIGSFAGGVQGNNLCNGLAATTPADARPGKPLGSTGCVEVWVGGNLIIDTNPPNNGIVIVDTGPNVGPSQGICCGWVDLFATGSITISGIPISCADPVTHVNPCIGALFSVAARQNSAGSQGGLVTALAITGTVNAFGRAFVADDGGSTGTGGTVIVQASGSVNLNGGASPNDPNGAALLARFTANASPTGTGVGSGGSIQIRSFNGTITGGPPSTLLATPAATGSVGLVVQGCDPIPYVVSGAVIQPPATVPPLQCGGAPSLPSFARIPKPLPVLTVTGAGTFTFDNTPHGVTATVTGLPGLPAPTGAVTIAYFDANNAQLAAAPVNIGVYSAVASFAGDATYGPISKTVTITIISTTAPAPVFSITGGTFVFDTRQHSATGTVTCGGAAVSPLVFTYSGLSPTVYGPTTAAPIDAGSYNVVASFAGSLTCQPGTSATTIVITRATATITLPSRTFTYDGNVHLATAVAKGVDGSALSPALTFSYNGLSEPQYVALNGRAGSYAVVASFAGNADYAPGQASATITVNPFTPAVVLNGPVVVSFGQPYTITGTVFGVRELLSPLVLGFFAGNVQLPGRPSAVGTYTVVGQYPGSTNYTSAQSAPIGLTILAAKPFATLSFVTATLSQAFDGRPKAVTVTTEPQNLTGVVVMYTGVDVTYGPTTAPPTGVGTYTVVASLANDVFQARTVTATLVVRAVEACVVVDFREITLFRDKTVLTSSDAGIRARNGLTGGFDPSLWPFDPSGRGDTTTLRAPLFRIYGFGADQVGVLIPDADNATKAYPVTADPDIPGAFFIDLGGPARVIVCVSELQHNLIDDSSPKDAFLANTGVLTDDQRNVPGIMLNHNAALLDVPGAVRADLQALGTPLLNAKGRSDDDDQDHHGVVDYIGFQLWGQGGGRFRKFVDAQIDFLFDSPADLGDHYRFGFLTASKESSCEYLDRGSGDDHRARFNDVWKRNHVGDPDFGPACGSRENAQNQKIREDYAVPFGAIQLLPSSNDGDDHAIRIHFGSIRSVDAVDRPPFIEGVHDQRVKAGSTLAFSVEATDPEGDAVTLSASGLPAGATFTPATGQFRWTPTSAQIGAHSVTFTATDAHGLSTPATITIVVTAK